MASDLRGRRRPDRPSRQKHVPCNGLRGKKGERSLGELKVAGGGDLSSEMTGLTLQVRMESRGRVFLVWTWKN